MLRFRFVLIAAGFLAAAPLFLNAQTPAPAAAPAPAANNSKASLVPFRAGTIYSAEIGRTKPAIDDESPFDQPEEKNPAWVELLVKINDERSISRFDYELIGRDGTYSCFAVAEGADAYSSDQDKWIIKKTNKLRYYRLLFPVKQSEIDHARNGLVPVTLKLKLFETKLPASEFQLRVIPNGERFISVSFPKLSEGLCNKNYEEARK